MSVELVALNASNVDLLRRIADEVFDHAIDPVSLNRFVDDERHVMVLAVDDRTVVGMASAVEYFHPDKQPQFFINEVGVATTHRRQGIGRSLVQALIEEAKRRGCTFAWLGTDTDNIAGQACFGSVPGAEEPQEFLLYEWNLDPRAPRNT